MTSAAADLPAKYRERVLAGQWFHSLTPALQDLLLANLTLRQLTVGQRLFARGDAADGLYCVADGSIKLTGSTRDGKEAILAIIEAPSWFGEIAAFDELTRTHDAWAEEATTLLHIPSATLNTLLTQHPLLWHALGLLLSHKIRLAFLALEELSLQPPASRLARRLLMMARGYGELEGISKREIRVPQEQLGQMLALSRQTVNQLLRQLESNGVVRLGRGGIEILDLAQLQILANL
jgi:CRP-like cAMP-binding protein